MKKLDRLASMIDSAFQNKNLSENLMALEFGNRISEDLDRLSKNESSYLFYCLSNAYSDRVELEKSKDIWQDTNIDNAILNIRKSIYYFDHTEEDEYAKYLPMILTNYGNLLLHVGRNVEAVEVFHKCLDLDPAFRMFHGNLASSLITYASGLQDEGHKGIMLHYANFHNDLAIKLDGYIESHALDLFLSRAEFLNNFQTELDYFNNFKYGDSEEENLYRSWWSQNILFINPLNDVTSQGVAAIDIMHLPSITSSLEEELHDYIYGVFNSLKQTYIYSRWTIFNSIGKMGENHPIADKENYLIYNLDSTLHNIHVESVLSAISSLYSVISRVPYLVKMYFLREDAEQSELYFSKIWFEINSSGRVKRGPDNVPLIHPKLKDLPTWGLRGIYWISKDFTSDKSSREYLDPDWARIDVVRHAYNHRYIKIKTMRYSSYSKLDCASVDVTIDELERIALRTLKTVRSILIYTHIAVYQKESMKRSTHNENAISIPENLINYSDFHRKYDN